MFEFLLKFPPSYYAEGVLILALPGWQMALAALGVFVLGMIGLGYSRLGKKLGLKDQVIVAALRSLAISLLLFSLSQPLLEVTARQPQPGVVGVLLDNSVSMMLDRGSDSGSRSDYIRQQFDDADGPLLQSLRDHFDTRLFSFGAHSRRLDQVDTLDFDEGDSDLNQALRFARASLQGEPVAGLVLISDGATQADEKLAATLLSLRADGIPVYSIGVGESEYPQDIEIVRIDLPRQALKGSRVNASLQIRQRGYDGETPELLVIDDSRIIHRQALELTGERQSLQVPLAIEDAGSRRLEFKIEVMPGERIAANNQRQAMLWIDPRRIRVLYFEGEPRFEFKFVRRAVEADEQIALSGLMRTADAKFYRVGIESEQELRNGFPITREELFSYDALILGSVELGLLSREQQDMIVEFVSRRGGGLLMLGGKHAFSEGGYRDSVLRDIAPVIMAPGARPDFSQDIRLYPTPAAGVHPALQIAGDSEESLDRWLTLPPVTIVNPIRQIKPGATLLLGGSARGGEAPYVGMAYHRYGRGKVVAFPVQNSWIWQMHQDIDIEDQTHEILWRQLLRWLSEGVPDRVQLTLSDHATHSDGRLTLRSEILQPDFSADNQAQARAVVTAPTGIEQIVELSRDPSLAGVYTAELSASETGDYQVRIETGTAGAELGSNTAQFSVSTEGGEYYQSQMNRALLQQIAHQTGGEFLLAGNAAGLAEALDKRQRGANVLMRHELWDMPLIFLLLVLLLGAEWGYRRWRKLI